MEPGMETLSQWGNSQGETLFSMVGIEQKHQRKTGAVTDEGYMSLMRIMLSR